MLWTLVLHFPQGIAVLAAASNDAQLPVRRQTVVNCPSNTIIRIERGLRLSLLKSPIVAPSSPPWPYCTLFAVDMVQYAQWSRLFRSHGLAVRNPCSHDERTFLSVRCTADHFVLPWFCSVMPTFSLLVELRCSSGASSDELLLRSQQNGVCVDSSVPSSDFSQY